LLIGALLNFQVSPDLNWPCPQRHRGNRPEDLSIIMKTSKDPLIYLPGVARGYPVSYDLFIIFSSLRTEPWLKKPVHRKSLPNLTAKHLIASCHDLKDIFISSLENPIIHIINPGYNLP